MAEQLVALAEQGDDGPQVTVGLRQAARELLGAQLGQAALTPGDLGIQLMQPGDRGGDRVVLDALDVDRQPRGVGVEIAIVGEHEHVQLGERIEGGSRA